MRPLLPPHPHHGRPPAGVGAPGLEPGTSALSGPRSNRLSYAPASRGRRHRLADATVVTILPIHASDPSVRTPRAAWSAWRGPPGVVRLAWFAWRRSPIRPQRPVRPRSPGATPALCPRRSARILRRTRAALSQLSYGPAIGLPVAPRTRPHISPTTGSGGRAWTRTRDLGLIRAAL